VGFDILVTLPVIWFFFVETTGVSLEDIDLLFGEGRALGTLPDDLHKESEIQTGQVGHVEESKDGEVATMAMETLPGREVHEKV
jgi:hypothetical protein